jgi:hypothetical protein
MEWTALSYLEHSWTGSFVRQEVFSACSSGCPGSSSCELQRLLVMALKTTTNRIRPFRLQLYTTGLVPTGDPLRCCPFTLPCTYFPRLAGPATGWSAAWEILQYIL